MSIKPTLMYSYIEAPTHNMGIWMKATCADVGVQGTKSLPRLFDTPIDEDLEVQGTKSLAGVRGVPEKLFLLTAAGGANEKGPE